MPFASIRHRVSNYEVWRSYFDADTERQRRYGVLRRRVFRASDDGSDVLLVFEIQSRERFRPLLEDQELKALMQKAGVVSDPVVAYWEDCGGLDLRGQRRPRAAPRARRGALVRRVSKMRRPRARRRLRPARRRR